MIQPMISVIIPVYNVEKYLDRCVQSVFRQTYKNIEIILVDDGSPDSCGKMCDEYVEKYPNVSCIHKPNGGLASARNAGLQKASGSYIGFLDSDDWVAEDMYEYLFNFLNEYNAEAAQIEYKEVYSESEFIKQPKENVSVYRGKDILQYYMTSTTINGNYSVCSCLFKKQVLEGICFREGRINEDIDYKYKVLEKCDSFVVGNLYKYYYFQSTGSITTSGLRKRDFQLYEAADALAQLSAKETYGTIAKLGRVKQARTAFSLLSRIAYYGYSNEITDSVSVEKKLIAEHRGNMMLLLRSPIPLSRKILSVMFAISFSLSKKTISVLKMVKSTLQGR